MKLDLHDLLHNFSAGQITTLREQPARTEAAPDVAADLGCDTYGQAIFMPHEDRFNQIAILQPEQKLDRPIR
ncbi:hypothetical protein D3C84_1249110 [compost metagenome]